MRQDSLFKLVTVVIPVYNYAEVLPRAVRSVIEQLDKDVELLVIDDGSTDNTPTVIFELQAEYPGSIRSIRKQNGGLASVRNLGIDEAAGRFLIFLDADDEMIDGALAIIKEHIRGNPDSQFIIGGHESVTPDGAVKTHVPGSLPETPINRVKAYLLDKKIALSNGACVMHRDVFIRGRYPENFRNAEDIPVFSQVLANEVCSVIREPLARIYKHSDSLRHNLAYSQAGGTELVEEVFLPTRLPDTIQVLKKGFYAQRCLSLSRTAYLAGDARAAKQFYWSALRHDWRVLFKWSYTRKMMRLVFR